MTVTVALIDILYNFPREREDRAVQIRKNVHEAAVELSAHLEPLGLLASDAALDAAMKIRELGGTFTDVNIFLKLFIYYVCYPGY